MNKYIPVRKATELAPQQRIVFMAGDQEIANGIALDYDPSRSTYIPSGGSKSYGQPMADHRHIAVTLTSAEDWFPAALCELSDTEGVRLSPHYKNEMSYAWHYNESGREPQIFQAHTRE